MPELKIASYNIALYNVINKARMDEIVDNVLTLADRGVSMICLQEVKPPQDGEFLGDDLLELLGLDWKGEFFVSPTVDRNDYGLAVLWRASAIEMKKFETLSLPSLQRLGAHEQFLELFLSRQIGPIQRGVLIGTFDFAGRRLRVCNLHADWHGGFAHRFRQLEHLKQYLNDAAAVDSEVICGDFNTIGLLRNTRQMEKIQSLLGEEFRSSFSEFQITTTHYQHLDHIFARNLKVRQAEVLELEGSDHYPVMASLSL